MREFLEHFSGSEKANMNKASRWYKGRAAIMDLQDDEVLVVSHPVFRRRTENGQGSVPRWQARVKAFKGRGRK